MTSKFPQYTFITLTSGENFSPFKDPPTRFIFLLLGSLLAEIGSFED